MKNRNLQLIQESDRQEETDGVFLKAEVIQTSANLILTEVKILSFL